MNASTETMKAGLLALLGGLALHASAQAQQPAAEPASPATAPAGAEERRAPPVEQLEPAVDTSAPVAPDKPAAAPASTTSTPKAAATPGPRAGRAQDRLELDATQITGNRELPKVLYIVPWKRADLGDLLGKPVNSLLDEVLAPVDRDVFRRENRYYRALQPQSAPQAQPVPSE